VCAFKVPFQWKQRVNPLAEVGGIDAPRVALEL